MSALAALPARERFLIGGALLGCPLLAWGYLAYDAHQMNIGAASCCARMQMSGPEFSSWPASTLPPLFAMWAIMMVGMMLPGALPMVLTFAAVSRNRRRTGRGYVPVAIFIAGYVIVWSFFSSLAAIAQWLLHRAALLSPAMASSSAIFGAVLLLAAGAFQFTPLKRACLKNCRSAFDFIMTRWREGRAGALRMGIEHGAFCTGCCWALMALLFVLGVMNLLWVAALTLLVCIEKMLPARAQVSLATGVLLIAWGAYLLLHDSLLATHL